jgi:hypothetical protein
VLTVRRYDRLPPPGHRPDLQRFPLAPRLRLAGLQQRRLSARTRSTRASRRFKPVYVFDDPLPWGNQQASWRKGHARGMKDRRWRGPSGPAPMRIREAPLPRAQPTRQRRWTCHGNLTLFEPTLQDHVEGPALW